VVQSFIALSSSSLLLVFNLFFCLLSFRAGCVSVLDSKNKYFMYEHHPTTISNIYVQQVGNRNEKAVFVIKKTTVGNRNENKQKTKANSR
jgi:hypothetical protein